MNSEVNQPCRIVILISGRGSNMQRIVEHFQNTHVHIVGVLSDKPQASGLVWAQQRGVHTQVLNPKDYPNRPAYDQALAELVHQYRPDYVVLAGFMRILGAQFVEQFYPRLINIHPSLLPAFTGLDTHQRALDAGVQFHGCSVHIVTPELDAGPIIAQAACQVCDVDDADSLAAKVLKLEHRLYPQVIEWLSQGRIALVDNNIQVHDIAWRGMSEL